MSKALDKFQTTHRRCLSLIDLYRKVINAKGDDLIPSDHASDILRSAVVLSISGMDAYFNDRFTELLIPFIKKEKTEGIKKLLVEAGLTNVQTVLELIMMDRPLRGLRTLIDKHFEKNTVQKFEAIDELFKAYNIPDLSKNAAGMTKKKSLLAKIKALISRRHKIAHNADLDSRGNLNKINYNEVKRQIEYLKLFVERCDELSKKITGVRVSSSITKIYVSQNEKLIEPSTTSGSGQQSLDFNGMEIQR